MVARMASSYFLSILEVISDAMNPGATALDVIFLLANSRANVFVSPSTPAYSTQHTTFANLQSFSTSCYWSSAYSMMLFTPGARHSVPLDLAIITNTMTSADFG
jgi:hypothetical protein